MFISEFLSRFKTDSERCFEQQMQIRCFTKKYKQEKVQWAAELERKTNS